MNTRVTFSLPDDVLAQLDTQARAYGIHKSSLVANALRIATRVYEKNGFTLANKRATAAGTQDAHEVIAGN